MSWWVRWRKGMKELSPLQLLEAKRFGAMGQVLGMFLAFVYVTFWLEIWYWALFLFFTLIVLSVDLISVNQQVKRLRRLTK